MKRRIWIVAILVAVVASSAIAAASAREPIPAPHDGVMRIRIEHSRFEPVRIQVVPGSTVRFDIVNTDPIDHEFILGDQALQDIHEVGTGHHHGLVPGEISVPAGSTRSTTYRFPASVPAGTLLFGCHLPRHYAYGMRGAIDTA